MDIQLKASLYKAMWNWVNDECASVDFPDVYLGDKTSEFMAEAACAVFDSIVEFQEYAIKEGFFEDQ